MKVTIGIIAYNEEKNIVSLLESLKAQTYPKEETEIILVDGKSTDRTKTLMLDFKNSNLDYWKIKVIDNEKRIQPAGLNVILDNMEGEIIIRIDAHSKLPPNFVEENVRCIESGEDVCGGKIVKVLNEDKGLVKQILLTAENSMFGSGIASYRRDGDTEYVKTIAHACYKKEVIDKVGKFDERLQRAEDNDMNYRVREAGYKICKSDKISSEYYTRPTLKGMLKQKYGNGKYIGIGSIIKTSKMFSLYHYIPMLFVIGLIVSTALFVPGLMMWNEFWWLTIPFIAGVGLYIIIDLSLTIKSSINYKQPLGLLLLPLLFPLLHISYGLGTIVGFCTARKYK